MGNNPPAYQYYPSDFNGDTAAWTVDEVGIYQRLLNYEWINGWKTGEGLPDDPKRLCQIARCGTKKFSKSWPTISTKFSKNGEGFLVNRRLEEEREIQREFRQTQRESGLRGVAMKKQKGIFPFDKSSDKSSNPTTAPTTDPATDPATQNQALHSSSSFLKEGAKKQQKALLDICEKISTKINKAVFNPYQFMNSHKTANSGAIFHVLNRIYKESAVLKGPWAYGVKILKVENQNYNEKDYVAWSEKEKAEFNKFVRSLIDK